MTDTFIMGVDIGGSHITAAMVKPEQKLVVNGSWSRRRINSHGTAEEIIQSWCDAIQDVFRLYPVQDQKIGFAMPGPFDYEKGISLIKGLDKYEALYGLNIKQLVADQLKIPVSNLLMMNDAAAFLRGEVVGGAGIGYSDAIGITLGTGTGTARHHRHRTEDANLGPSPFKDSIADEYFSTRWFVKRYHQLTGHSVKDVKELADLHETIPEVKQIFSEFTLTFTSFLADFIRTDQPQVIVLGGNIAQCSDLFLPGLEQNLATLSLNISIRKAVLGEEAAILGAASLFIPQPSHQVIL